MTSGLDVLVHEVIAAITTEPLFKVYYLPLYWKLEGLLRFSGLTPNPLNPGLVFMHELKSSFILLKTTLS